jgi:UDP-2-acetamido-2,6-beta-L-arabino-hexul-4-ose reductase
MQNLHVNQLEIKRDARGWLVEVLKRDELEDQVFGQFLVTTANPGAVKGNHYHHRKREWFCVVRGRALLAIEDVETGERREIAMGDDNMVTVAIPPFVAHGIRNVGDEMMYLAVYTDEVFDPANPDTYRRIVME